LLKLQGRDDMVDGEAGSNNSEPSPDIKNKSRATMLNDEEMLADGGFLLKRNKEKGGVDKEAKSMCPFFRCSFCCLFDHWHQETTHTTFWLVYVDSKSHCCGINSCLNFLFFRSLA